MRSPDALSSWERETPTLHLPECSFNIVLSPPILYQFFVAPPALCRLQLLSPPAVRRRQLFAFVAAS
eukprot:1744720-Prymnesium_polylepis.1